MSFASGETVLYQEVWNGRVWAARPLTMVQDDGDFVALWFPKGTVWKRPITPPGNPKDADRGTRHARLLRGGDWVFEDATWDVSTLLLVGAHEWSAIWLSWLDDGTQWGWYVNLQEPLRRTVRGFETMDLALDVLIENDRTWRWKDDDELRTFVEMGVFDASLAERLREEGERVARRAQRNAPPFDGPWPEWKPDPSWSRPGLLEGWDELCR